MNILNKAFCRTFQFAFRVAIPFLPYREPERFSSIAALAQPLKKWNIRSVLLVTDEFLKKSGATEELENMLHMAGSAKFIYAIRQLNAAMGIPEKLSGIRKEDIPAMAKHAHHEANPLYPVPKLMDAKELEQFYYTVADWSETNGH